MKKIFIGLFLCVSLNLLSQYNRTLIDLVEKEGCRVDIIASFIRKKNLESNGTNVFKKYNILGTSALSCAVQQNNKAVVKFFLDCGVDVNILDKETTKNPLYYAVSWKHLGMVKYLLDKGASYDFSQCRKVRTSVEIISLLQSRGMMLPIKGEEVGIKNFPRIILCNTFVASEILSKIEKLDRSKASFIIVDSSQLQTLYQRTSIDLDGGFGISSIRF